MFQVNFAAQVPEESLLGMLQVFNCDLFNNHRSATDCWFHCSNRSIGVGLVFAVLGGPQPRSRVCKI